MISPAQPSARQDALVPERGSPAPARCASTEVRPPVPFLSQNHIQRLPYLSNPNQFDPIDGIQLGQVPFWQQTTFESHLGRFPNPHLNLTDRTDFTTEPHLT